MGTSWRASLVAEPAMETSSLALAIEARLDAVCAAMSPWREDSEISAFNRATAGERVILSPAFASVLVRALEIASLTRGAFDPTAGRGVPGRWRDLDFDPATRQLVQPGGLRLDLSAIAKGYGVDVLSDCLAQAGARAHLAEIGGEFAGRGVKPDGRPWWVALESLGANNQPQSVVALSDGALATSGYQTATGRPLGQVVDPRDGRPLAGDTLAVTVLAGCCMDADAFATGLLVLGADRGLAVADALGLAARFLVRTARGVEARFSSALRAMTD